ncbi:MAG TPA: MmcQ/YjbR family DNA-binding protein [Planctomycetota bacterium]|nr:MmcQ/YjbR family DNA-binding protein [Planctomycetota bacterium]
MDPEQFRSVALSMPDAHEGAHMQHPDFRANGRIFATLHGDGEWGMVKLAPPEQARLVAAHPGAFVPANGAWGRQGCTNVRLAAVDRAVLRDAMTLAWQGAMQATARRATRAARAPRGPRRR